MIKDKLKNAKNYYNLSENLKKGFSWLLETDLKSIDDGRYEIDGNNVYASVQTYTTKSDANYEALRKYIDIQYLIKGKEFVGVTDLSNCNTCIQYDFDKDLEFFNCSREDDYFPFREGEFLVLYPNDAHKPSIDYEGLKNEVKKVVVKVAV